MKSMEQYIDEIKKELPDIEKQLNDGVSEGQWKNFEDKINGKLPLELKELYTKSNGENQEIYTGFFAGLEFLPLEKMLSEFEYFQSVDFELMAMGTDDIREAPVGEHIWLPFAFDNDSSYLAIDLTPTASGTSGQVITMDFEYDKCYKLADSLSDLFEKMTSWLKQGVLIVQSENDEKFISEKSGHLFNALDDLTAKEENTDDVCVDLPTGYWAEHYEKSAVKGEDGRLQVKAGVLSKEKKLWIKGKKLSCELFAYMDNLKELILHECEIENFRFVAKAAKLQRLILADCTLTGDDFSALAKAPALKDIGINVMTAAGIGSLAEIKTLKRLLLRKVTDFDEKVLYGFTGLQELELDTLELNDTSIIANIKGLKKLYIKNILMKDLNFLSSLKKLTEFESDVRAVDESGLAAVGSLVKLKSFLYPVTDLEIYKGHPSLNTVGFEGSVDSGFEAFEGSQVNCFEIFNCSSGTHAEDIRKKMECYVKISSYGYRDRK